MIFDSSLSDMDVGATINVSCRALASLGSLAAAAATVGPTEEPDHMAIEVANLKCETCSDSQAIFRPIASKSRSIMTIGFLHMEERDCGQKQKYTSYTKRREERTLTVVD